jgi:cytochrome b subunit of formate dehydrogenase
MQRRVLLIILALLLVPAAAQAADPMGCLACHNAEAENIPAGDREIQMKFDEARFKESLHGFLTCTDCHERFLGDNFHFVPEGAVTPTVNDLSVKLASKPGPDPVARAACVKCHTETFDKLLGSVHGKNVAEKGEPDGPLCADCHGSPHYMARAADPASPVNRKNVVKTCGHCHEDEKLAEKYGIESDVMESYRESFHGRKLEIGHSKAPTCVNCHGSHDIMPSDDPASMVAGANKISTCDKCHPGANETFVAAITHEHVGPIPHWTEKGLIALVIGTIGFVILHFLLEAFSDLRDSLFRKKEPEAELPDDHDEVPRFNIHFRIQHILLFSTFLILAFTGWGLKYAYLEQSHWLIKLSGGAEMAGLIHRVAGIIMVSTFLYHVLYVVGLIAGGKVKFNVNTTVIPMPKDALDAIDNFKYYLGLSDHPARCGRFNYKQKFDYWAVFWGMAIIGSSGVALAFPIAASALIPDFTSAWIWQLLAIMHSDEALLAIVFIFFWHFYNEHLKPDTFPMSWVWITGRLSKKDMRHHHPLEYEIIEKEKKGGK